MKFVHLLAAALAMVVAGCAESAPVGTRTDALDANANNVHRDSDAINPFIILQN